MSAASDPAGAARRLVALDPGRAEAQQQLGLATAVRALADAVRPLRRVTWLAPLAVDAHLNLGIALFALGRHGEAGAAFRRVLVLAPGDPDALHGLGVVDAEEGAQDPAIRHLGRAVGLRPDNVETLVRLANVLARMRRSNEAAALERRALVLAPSRAPALFDLGLALSQTEQHRASVIWSLRALAVEPHSIQAEINISASLLILGRTAEAIDRLRRAASRDDAGPEPFRNLLAALSYSSKAGEEERWESARAFEARHAAAADHRPFAVTRDAERRLTVGYVSSDFYDHPVARNLAPIIEAHDRNRFQVLCYSDAAVADEMARRVHAAVDGWRPTAGLTDADVARQVRDDRVDILVIVGGRFDKNRPLVASHRAAPLQMSLFDGGTSGLAEMDYLIADRTLVAALARRRERFTEHVLRLPSLYVHAPVAEAPPVAEPPSLRSRYVTFGCFNSPLKLSDETLGLWGLLLREMPTARLRLKYLGRYQDPDLRSRVLRGLGTDPGRVDFLWGRDSLVTHLGNYGSIDIALDTFPFTGSTTTWEALWMGVPVVTLLGDALVGRLTASFLRPVKLDELVAATPADYLRIARTLAEDPARLATLRASLRGRVARSPLCDPRTRARQIERLYRATWRRWCRAGS